MILAGIDIEQKDKFGNTPLINTAFGNKIRSLRVLIDEKANIEARGHILLINKAKNGQTPFIRGTPLLGASATGHTECVEELLQHGADIEARDKNGDSALTLAAGFGHVNTIKVLLQHKANTEVEGNNGRAALGCASVRGYEECVKELLQHGANINASDMDGDTPLHCAIHGGKIKNVGILLRQTEIDLTKKNNDGETAMDVAKKENS